MLRGGVERAVPDPGRCQLRFRRPGAPLALLGERRQLHEPVHLLLAACADDEMAAERRCLGDGELAVDETAELVAMDRSAAVVLGRHVPTSSRPPRSNTLSFRRARRRRVPTVFCGMSSAAAMSLYERRSKACSVKT